MSSAAAGENRPKRPGRVYNYNPDWKWDFCFVENQGMGSCLLCETKISLKKYNVSRHYVDMHKFFHELYPPGTDLRKSRIVDLEKIFKQTLNRTDVGTDCPHDSDFTFPGDAERRALWLQAIGRADLQVTKFTVVCIEHFEEKYIQRFHRATRPDGSELVIPRERLCLTDDAVPTIIPDDATVKRRTPRKHAGRMRSAGFKTENYFEQAGAAEEAAGPSNAGDSTPVPEIPFVDVKEEPIWDDEADDSNLQAESENKLEIDESAEGERKPATDLTLGGPKAQLLLTAPPKKLDLLKTASDETAPPAKRSRTEEDSDKMGDEFVHTGQNVAKKLARMEPVQAIYAESLISSVLMKGLLGKLSEQTDICENGCSRKPVPAQQSQHISTTAIQQPQHITIAVKEEEPTDL